MPVKTVELTVLDYLPRSVKILHNHYQINADPEMGVVEKGHLGEILHKERKINVVQQGGSDLVDTLIHEILHGIHHLFDAGSDEEEEHIVRVLATGITTVMKDNPDLFPTLQKILDQDNPKKVN
jgi:hypothetical protein